jgi:hypothetical protein
VFEAVCLRITYDKPNRRIEISATITEAIADALENTRDLPGEVSSVAQRDIAGAGFEHLSPTLAYRFVEVVQLRP